MRGAGVVVVILYVVVTVLLLYEKGSATLFSFAPQPQTTSHPPLDWGAQCSAVVVSKMVIAVVAMVDRRRAARDSWATRDRFDDGSRGLLLGACVV